jgi:hypothetical protein
VANHERIYQRVSHEQLEKCLRWCQNVLNLRDWEIDFHTGTPFRNERAAGWTMELGERQRFLMQAEIWVDKDYCKEKDDNPYVVVCHEALHVLIGGKCMIDSDNDEYITYTLDDILYLRFCEDNKIKVMPKKE